MQAYTTSNAAKNANTPRRDLNKLTRNATMIHDQEQTRAHDTTHNSHAYGKPRHACHASPSCPQD
eukprot:1493477-Lingulodinium_polyedra.AAC.1